MRPPEPPILQPAKFQRNRAMRGWVIAILLNPPPEGALTPPRISETGGRNATKFFVDIDPSSILHAIKWI